MTTKVATNKLSGHTKGQMEQARPDLTASDRIRPEL
jgi:hypothetical protein